MASVPFNNLITFSRGSNATLTGPDGLIQWAPNNLLTFSEQFDNAAWSKQAGVSVTGVNVGVAPDGTTTADEVTFTATTNDSIYQGLILPANTTYAFSVWVKGLGGQVVQVSAQPNAAPPVFTSVTLNGQWQRVTAIATTGATAGTLNAAIDLVSGTTPAVVLIWGAQLELGSAATTYNSTTVKNLLGFSEAFDNAGWSKTRASIVTGAQANPVNGAFNAQKLMVDTTAAATHSVSQEYSLGASVPVTVSVYVKAAEYTTGRLTLIALSGAFPEMGVTFNLTAGTITPSAGSGTTVLGSSITQLSNGWYRVSISGFTGLSGLHRVVINPNTNSPFTGDGNSGVYIYGAQLSDSASLDPYVPTPAAAPSSTAYYGPRFDYDPVTLQPKGLLVEEARTNLLTYSDQFDNAAWQKLGGAVTVNTTASPDGTTNADTFTASAGLAFHYVNRASPGSLTGAYTYSFYVKKNTATWIFFTVNDTSINYFNLDTGLFGTTPDTCTVVPAGNGWYKITVLRTLAAAAAQCGVGVAGSNGGANFTAVGTESIFIYGAQLEAGAFATSYIPTVASTVTRSADVATINGSLFSQWYAQTRGTFVMNFTPDGGLTSASTRVLSVSSGGVANRVIDVNYFGVNWTNYNGTSTLAIGAAAVTTIPQRIAAAYATANYGYTLNGGTVAADTSALVNSPTQLNLGNLDTGNFLNGHIRSIDYIPTRIADFQLQALTELPLVPTLDLDFLNNLYEA